MAWPHSQDYNEAVQSPRVSFSDPELRAGEAVAGPLGIPRPCSGNFADVYQVHCPASGARWAVKCFTRQVHGLRERYAAISAHLGRSGLPFTVGFQFLEEGVRVRGDWFPVVKMQWVEGLTLNEFVRGALDRPALLEALGNIWQRMAARLGEADLAHGDLQHGNVLLVPGSGPQSLKLKLIDYDGLWVPALAGRPSGEVGHASYQHPRRLHEQTYSREVDRYPLLLVACALRALTVGGRALWERYDNGDNLLFTAADLRAPAESPLFRELSKLQDPLARALAGRLAEAGRRPPEQTPLLQELPAAEPPAARAAERQAVQEGARSETVAVATEAEPDFDFAPEDGAFSRRKGGRSGRRSLLPWILAGMVALLVIGVLGAVGGATVWATRKWAPRKSAQRPPVQVRAEIGAEGPKTPQASIPSQPPADNKPPPEEEKAAPPAEEEKPAEAKPPERPADEVRRFEGHGGPVHGVAFSTDGKRVLSGSADGTARLWDTETGKSLQIFRGHTGPVWGVALSPDGWRAATAGEDKSVRLWGTESGKELARLDGHTQRVWTVAFSPDGRRLLSAADDGAVRLWDAEGRAELRHFDHTTWARCAAFSPDGRYALSACFDKFVRLWSLEGGRKMRELAGHSADPFGCAFLSDGRRAVSAGLDGTLRLWDLAGGRGLLRVQAHPGRIWGVAVSPDDRWALTAGEEGTVGLWDLASGKGVKRFPCHCRLSVAFSPDGRFALTGGQDSVMHLWRLPAEVAAGAPAARKPPPRPAVPDAKAQAEAEKKIKEVYLTEYAGKSPEDRQALATKLLERALKTGDGDARRYVLLREARDLAARAGNLPLSLRAVEEASFLFAADETEGKRAALQAALKAQAVAPASLAVTALADADAAVAADNYDGALALLAVAKSAARKAPTNLALANKVARAERRVSRLRGEHASARSRAAKAGGPEENLALGRFQCLHKEDWARGLPLLAAGSDPALAELARKDLGRPTAAEEQAEVGHGWWDFAQKYPDRVIRDHVRRRAREWFQRALPRLSDAERAKVEEKLKVVIGRFVGKPGLVAELFADEGMKTKAASRIDYQVNFNWGFGPPADGLPADHFSARWQGWLLPPRKGKYTLIVHADDGCKLYVDRKLVIDAWGKLGRRVAEVALDEKPHPLKIEFREGTGTAMMYFGWVPEGGAEQAVPMEALYHDTTQEKLYVK